MRKYFLGIPSTWLHSISYLSDQAISLSVDILSLWSIEQHIELVCMTFTWQNDSDMLYADLYFQQVKYRVPTLSFNGLTIFVLTVEYIVQYFVELWLKEMNRVCYLWYSSLQPDCWVKWGRLFSTFCICWSMNDMIWKSGMTHSQICSLLSSVYH